MCGTAPITDQPAAQAYPSDDFCLRSKWVDKCDPKPLIPKEQVKGCLLYTSPSPRDDPLSRMPSSA